MNLIHTDPIEAYFELKEKRPDLFGKSDFLPVICIDREKMTNFTVQTGKKLGVVYNNYPFFFVVADLCEKKQENRVEKNYFSYARVVYCNPESNGTVTIPYCKGKLGLLSIFRHAPRQNTGWEFPRGFLDVNVLTPLMNAHKELFEEMGIQTSDILKTTYLGDVRADAGLSSGKVQIYLAEITLPDTITLEKEEGIAKYNWFSPTEITEMIQTEQITDGFTLSAFMKFVVKQ